MKVELLAPAGNMEMLKAAVQSGADAVYLAGKKFGARSYAGNFTDDELSEVVKYCHIRDVSVYIAVNTMVKEPEIIDLMKYIDFLYSIDIDALIIQDQGIVSLVQKKYPDFELHASTQMAIHNVAGVNAAVASGIGRTVIARETNIDQIKEIVDQTSADIEVFVHGALCYAYSGQCLMSSMIGGRSGNRGRCAQPCRKPYELYSGNQLIETKGDYLLSPRDLMTIEDLSLILDTGVKSLKIEGRMRSTAYVKEVVTAYRAAIDAYESEHEYLLTNDQKSQIQAVYNRKMTSGLVLDQGEAILNSGTPGNLGVEVGMVESYDKRLEAMNVRLTRDIIKGDGLKIVGEKEDLGLRVIEIGTRNGKAKSAKAGEVVQLKFKKPIEPGCKLHRTYDARLLSDAESFVLKENRKVMIKGRLTLKVGEFASLEINDYNGNEVSVVTDVFVEKATNKPLDDVRITTQMNKLGNTPYQLESFDLVMDKDAVLAISVLNGLRREAIENLNEKRANRYKRQQSSSKVEFKNIQHNEENIQLLGEVDTLEKLERLIETEIDGIYYTDLETLKEAYEMTEQADVEMIPALPNIAEDSVIAMWKHVIDGLETIKSVRIANVSQIDYFKEISTLRGDYHLNISNSFCADYYYDRGVGKIALSTELNLDEIKAMLNHVKNDIELMAYGKVKVMTSKNCPITGKKVTPKSNCSGCEKSFTLIDEKRFEFEGKCFGGYFHLYNSKKMHMIGKLDDLIELGIGSLRLDLTTTDSEAINPIVADYKTNLRGSGELSDPELHLYDDVTFGHYYRGVE